MAASSSFETGGRAMTHQNDFERWKDDLLLRESLISEAALGRSPLSRDACRSLRTGFNLSPEEFGCLENVVLGRGCAQCPCGRAEMLASRSLLQVHVDAQGHRSCTASEITAFVYETAMLVLQAMTADLR